VSRKTWVEGVVVAATTQSDMETPEMLRTFSYFFRLTTEAQKSP